MMPGVRNTDVRRTHGLGGLVHPGYHGRFCRGGIRMSKGVRAGANEPTVEVEPVQAY